MAGSGWEYPPTAVARTIGVNCLAGGTVGTLTIHFTHSTPAILLFAIAWCWWAMGLFMVVAAPILSRRSYLVFHLAGVASITLFCAVAGGSAAAVSGIFLQIVLVAPALVVLRNWVARMTTLLNGLSVVYLGFAVGDLPPIVTCNALLVLLALTVSAGWVQSVASMAEVDDLTGLPNRRRLTRELNSTPGNRGRRSIDCIAVVDIDRFKSINDRFGHEAGDYALVSVARALDHGLPEATVCRSGGDEFTVLCSTGGADQVGKSIDHIRAHLHMDITISAGVAQCRDGELVTNSLRRADRALYLSKTQGRSCTTVDC